MIMIVTYSLVCWYPCLSCPKWTVDQAQCSRTPLWTLLPHPPVSLSLDDFSSHFQYHEYNCHCDISVLKEKVPWDRRYGRQDRSLELEGGTACQESGNLYRDEDDNSKDHDENFLMIMVSLHLSVKASTPWVWQCECIFWARLETCLLVSLVSTLTDYFLTFF